MKHHAQPKRTGQQLVADYQTVMVSSSAIDAAAYEAERSENELMQYLASTSSGNYLQPGDLGNPDESSIGRASLDAHVKRVQAQQLQALNHEQIRQLSALDKQDFIGRQVIIEQLDPSRKCIELLWFDTQNGYRSNPTNKRRIYGIIEDVLLDKNILLIKPRLRNRLLTSNLQGYVVYVIDPVSAQPLVSCSAA